MKLKLEGTEKIKNIIFDFGNVILDIDVPLSLEAFKKIGISGFDESYIHPHTKGPWLELELGLISCDEFIEKVRTLFPEAKDIEEQKIWDGWNALLLDYDPKRVALLAEVKKNYNIYLLSNTNLPHRIYFFDVFEKKFGYRLENEFKECFYSDAMHLRKPDPKIYQGVIDATGINPEESLFIDDNFCNFSGAEAVGMKWYHLTGGETILDIFE